MTLNFFRGAGPAPAFIAPSAQEDAHLIAKILLRACTNALVELFPSECGEKHTILALFSKFPHQTCKDFSLSVPSLWVRAGSAGRATPVFLMAGIILLVAMVEAIVLTMQSRTTVPRQHIFQKIYRDADKAIYLV